jgi:predicted dehydrogenase
MLRVGIVGCGKIADSHATQILRAGDNQLVGVCDREPLMAKQLAERFPVDRHFDSFEEMIEKSCPDVVHITTPPVSHFLIAKYCLEHGCNVYVEKPFTVNLAEAEELVEVAQAKGLRLTAGHNYQFSHAARRMRALVSSGYLGGRPVHMESYYGYDLGDPAYAKAFLGDKRHWVRALPGQLLQNVISHGVARVAEFLANDDPVVIAHGFTSPLLRSLGETEIVDELRVIISGGEETTAYFTFSSQMKPVLQQFRIYGPKNSVILDQNHEVVLELKGKKFKSYADFFIPPVFMAAQQVRNLRENIGLFVKHDFHMDTGMKYLIRAFYHSIKSDTEVPIPYREIVLTAKIMDSIFAQTGARNRVAPCSVAEPTSDLAPSIN